MNYIAFDFDGTIADSNFAICEAMERACIRHGVTYVGDDELSQHIGKSLDEVIKNAGAHDLDEEKIEGITRSYRETFRDNLVNAYEGMPRLLELCHDTGDRLAIASSRSSRSLNKLIEQLEIKELVDVIVGGDEAPTPKPDGSMLWEVSTRFGCNPREVIVVGDSIWDIEMAKSCGAYAIGVTWGAHEETDLRSVGADLICNSPTELANHFNFATV